MLGTYWVIAGLLLVGCTAHKPTLAELRAINAKKAADQAAQVERALDASARGACKSRILGQLKSPKSADFDNTQSGPAAEDSTLYRVKGRVTAVNSFNSPLTHEYQCDLTRSENLLSNPSRTDISPQWLEPGGE